MAAPNQAGPAGGTFITFEGGEGVGKSTHTRCIGHLLRQAGHTVTVTREPGGSAVGESVRDLLMQNFEPAMPAMSELLLFFAARAAHLAQVIEPALARGEIVLCDRFTDTSYAYQGIARGLGVDAVSTLETLVQGDRRPDLTFVLDLACDTGLARAREIEPNRFESETLVFHQTVRQGFLQLAEQNERYRVIDASADLETVQHDIWQMLCHEQIIRSQAA